MPPQAMDVIAAVLRWICVAVLVLAFGGCGEDLRLSADARPVATEAASRIPATCPFASPCVLASVDRPHGQDPPAGTVVRFYGRGFAVGTSVEASWGSYCPPNSACAGVGLLTSFEADRRGRFTFRFRYGSQPPAGPEPKGAGSEEVRFAGVGRGGRPAAVVAAPVPPPSTARERRQARAVGRETLRLARAIGRNADTTQKALDAYEDELGRCGPAREAARDAGRRQEAVEDRLTDAAIDAATFGVDGSIFAAFADRLEALELTPGRLRDGAAAWIEAIRAPRYVPTPSLCTVIRTWQAAGFSRAAEPVAPSSRGFDEQLRADRRVPAGGQALRDLGVDATAQALFGGGELLGLENYITDF